MIMLVAAVQLITVHMIDGREVQIAPSAVIRLQHAEGPNKLIPDAVECVIWFTDGNFLSVMETCNQVRELLGKE